MLSLLSSLCGLLCVQFNPNSSIVVGISCAALSSAPASLPRHAVVAAVCVTAQIMRYICVAYRGRDRCAHRTLSAAAAAAVSCCCHPCVHNLSACVSACVCCATALVQAADLPGHATCTSRKAANKINTTTSSSNNNQEAAALQALQANRQRAAGAGRCCGDGLKKEGGKMNTKGRD